MYKRDLTLTESTGMLRDAAVEQAKRAVERRAARERRAALAELEFLRHKVEQKRARVAKQRRLIRRTIIIGCTLGLLCGLFVGRALWQGLSDKVFVVEQ